MIGPEGHETTLWAPGCSPNLSPCSPNSSPRRITCLAIHVLLGSVRVEVRDSLENGFCDGSILMNDICWALSAVISMGANIRMRAKTRPIDRTQTFQTLSSRSHVPSCCERTQTRSPNPEAHPSPRRPCRANALVCHIWEILEPSVHDFVDSFIADTVAVTDDVTNVTS